MAVTRSLMLMTLLACLVTGGLRLLALEHGGASENVDDLQMRDEGLKLWEASKTGQIRQALRSQHKYPWLGAELVAGWTWLRFEVFGDLEGPARWDITRNARLLCVLLSLAAILFITLIPRDPWHRCIAALLGASLLVPFQFSLMTRPHIVLFAMSCLALLTARLASERPTPGHWALLGLSCGLATSTLPTGAVTLLLACTLWWPVRDRRLIPPALLGLATGLLPGYVDALIAWWQPEIVPIRLDNSPHVDWTREPFNFSPGFAWHGALRTFIGHDPLLLIGIVAGWAHCRGDRFARACLLASSPLALILILHTREFPRYWMMLYPYLVPVALLGWARITRRRGPWILGAAVLASLAVQGRVATLLGHDLRDRAEHELTGMLPDGSLVLVETTSGCRFLGQSTDDLGFEVLSPESPDPAARIHGSQAPVFWLTDDLSTTAFDLRIVDVSREIHRWSAPGPEPATRNMPNDIPWPWVDVWRRGASGPNLSLATVDTVRLETP